MTKDIEIRTDRLNRVLGHAVRSNDWEATPVRAPIKTVSRSRLVRTDWDFTSATIIGVCSAAWMIACFRLIFQVVTIHLPSLANWF